MKAVGIAGPSFAQQVERKVLARLDADSRRQIGWERVILFTNIMKFANLRKSRTRLIVKAIEHPGEVQEKGNIAVRKEEVSDVITFSYRGTDIMKWNGYTGEIENLDAGQFEHTTSTKYQRKMVGEAIEEFNRQVLGVCG